MNGIKPIPKRVPLTRSGKLLVSILQRKVIIAATDYIEKGAANKQDIEDINKLVSRIQGRLDRESIKLFPQSVLFQNFKITFIRPKRKRKQTLTVDASTRHQARKMIRDLYGKQTQIIQVHED